MSVEEWIHSEVKKTFVFNKMYKNSDNVFTVIWSGLVLIITTLVIVGVFLEINIQNGCKTPRWLSAEYENRSVLLTWDVTHDECNFTYLLHYTVNNSQEFQISTTAFSNRISDIDVCSVLQFNFWTIDAHGEIHSDYISRNYTAVPRNTLIQDLKFSKTARGVQATWPKPTELFACEVFYDVEYSTEFYTSPRVQVYSGEITIPAESFCLQFRLRIDVRVDDFISSSTAISYGDRDELGNVTLSVPFNNPKTLVVTWNGHPKQELCLLQYDVLYTPNEGEIQNKLVANPEASFSFTYCDKANISITIVGPKSTISGSTTAIEVIHYPNIARVTDLNIVTNLDSMSLSWPSIPTLGLCEWSYEAKVWTDIGNFTYTAAVSPIEFPGNSYCFFIEVGVRTIYDDDHFSEMTTTHIRYELEPVRNLKLIEPIKDNILTITWTGHRKQEQCNIQYHVAYEHGTVQDTFTTTLTTMDFVIVYDVIIHIRVKAVSGDRESEENTITHTEAYPYPNQNTVSWGSSGSPDYSYDILITVVLQFMLRY